MITKEKLEELEKQHGRIAHLKGPPVPGSKANENGDREPCWEIVLKKPTRQQYAYFRKLGHNEQRKSEAQEELVSNTMVYPSTKSEVEALLDEWPGIPEAATKAIMSLTGMAVDEDLKT